MLFQLCAYVNCAACSSCALPFPFVSIPSNVLLISSGALFLFVSIPSMRCPFFLCAAQSSYALPTRLEFIANESDLANMLCEHKIQHARAAHCELVIMRLCIGGYVECTDRSSAFCSLNRQFKTSLAWNSGIRGKEHAPLIKLVARSCRKADF